tara:strand:+ start:5918 stop:6415 length:498 start_codon:yes stop_codon:yes gene_type:complete
MPPVSFEADLTGSRTLAAALQRMSSPEVTAAWMRRAGRELRAEMELHVSGPRPHRLDVVTGELRRSFGIKTNELPERIRVGTPLFWAEFHEVGTARGARIQRSRRGRGMRRYSGQPRPFVQPSLEIVLRRLPGIIAQEQAAYLRGAVASSINVDRRGFGLVVTAA